MSTCGKCGTTSSSAMFDSQGINLCASCAVKQVQYKFEVSSNSGIYASVAYGSFKMEFSRSPEEVSQWFQGMTQPQPNLVN